MTETNGGLVLREFPLPVRIVLAVFLMSVGIGYVSALVQLHFQQASPGQLLPGPAEVEHSYHGRPSMGQFERLIVADENRPFNGSGQMSQAFFTKSSSLKRVLRDKAKLKEVSLEEAEKLVRADRQMEIDAIVGWIHAGARKGDYTAFPVPAFAEQLARDNPEPEFFEQSGDTWTANIEKIIDVRCARCHSEGKGGPAAQIHLDRFDVVLDYVHHQDRGGAISLEKLAQSTHVHLLGFSMLYGLTGLIFAFSSFPVGIRLVLAPLALLAQLADIGCWWLARTDPLFARAIIVTGGVVAMSLGLQIVLSLFNMFSNRGRLVLVLLILAGAAAAGGVKLKVIDPHLEAEKTLAKSMTSH